ncbi:hypothetical protein CFP56_038746 [Quercus suber]|uniref:Uncharacterized protein n=1 Tax=Quercus suber TaxID=58331 RepID=A0AAW0J1J0_QUESU
MQRLHMASSDRPSPSLTLILIPPVTDPHSQALSQAVKPSLWPQPLSSPPQLGAGKLSPTNPPSLSLAVGNSLHLAVRSGYACKYAMQVYRLFTVELVEGAMDLNFGRFGFQRTVSEDLNTGPRTRHAKASPAQLGGLRQKH